MPRERRGGARQAEAGSVGELAFSTALTLVFFMPVSLLTVDGAIGGVPAAMVDGLFETITTPLTAFGLDQSVVKSGFCGIHCFTSQLPFTLHSCREGCCMLCGQTSLKFGQHALLFCCCLASSCFQILFATCTATTVLIGFFVASNCLQNTNS